MPCYCLCRLALPRSWFKLYLDPFAFVLRERAVYIKGRLQRLLPDKNFTGQMTPLLSVTLANWDFISILDPSDAGQNVKGSSVGDRIRFFPHHEHLLLSRFD